TLVPHVRSTLIGGRTMRTAVYATLVTVACGPADNSRPSSPAQKYAGTWEGRSFRSSTDTGTPFRIVAHVAEDGTLRSTLLFTAVQAPPVPIRARHVSRSEERRVGKEG